MNDAADKLLERDAKYVTRPWSGTGEPVPIVKARGSIVTDAYGKDFVDFTSGYFVNQVGHCHPKVMAAATRQLSLVTQVSGRHTTPALVDLAEALVTQSPKSLEKVFFTTGGTESNEHALKMVRQFTKKTDIACIDNTYHGLTYGVIGACSNPKYQETAAMKLPDVFYHLPTPYCYRCKHHDKDCATQCLDGVEKQIDSRPNTAALLAEPMQAIGGIIPPVEWWNRLDKIRKAKGLLLMLDEIQTGMGRTGTMFGAEHYGLEPDLLIVGKGVSGAVGSLGGVLSRKDIAKVYAAGTTPTSAGNAVSAAAGLALMQVLREEKVLENATAMGKYATEAVLDLKDPWVGDVRWKGLLGGVELVIDKQSKEILPKDLVVAVKDAMHEDGILLTISGPLGNVLRLQPVLTINRNEMDLMVSALSKALTSVRKQKGIR